MLNKLFGKFKISLKFRLITLLLFFSLLSLGSLAFSLIYETNQTLLSNLQETQITLANSSTNAITNYLEQISDNLTFLAKKSQLTLDNNFFTVTILREILNNNPQYNEILLINSSGDYLTASENIGTLSDQTYYSQTLTRNIQISKPLHFTSTEKWEFLVMVPFTTIDNKEAFLAATISLENIAKILDDVKISRSGYPYLIDKDNNFLYHPDKKIIMNSKTLESNSDFKDVVRDMFASQQGYQEYTYDNKENIQSYTTVPGTDWILAITANTNDFKKQITHFRKIATILIVISCLIFVVAMYIIIHYLIRKIRHIQQYMKEVEAGKLTQRIPNKHLQKCWEFLQCNKPQCPAYHSDNLRCWQIVGTHCNGSIQSNLAAKLQACENCKVYHASCGDELTQLAECFNSMINTQMCTVQMVLQTAENMAKTAENLSGAMQESNATIEEISASTEQLNASSVQIASKLETTANHLNQITELSHDTSRSSLSAREQSLEIEKQVNAGEQNAIKTEEKMLRITNENQTMYNHMCKLEDATKEIQKIITAISNVAEQTNLLALNAQIEAARAGEEGRGFAVVANEINELASESSSSAHQIAGILKNIQTSVTEVSQIMANEVQEINEGLTAVKDLKERIITINHSLSKTNHSIQNIADLAVSYVEKADETNSQIQTITQSITEHVHSFGAVTDSLSEQNANFQEVSAAAMSLSEISEKLLESIQFFKLS